MICYCPSGKDLLFLLLNNTTKYPADTPAAKCFSVCPLTAVILHISQSFHSKTFATPYQTTTQTNGPTIPPFLPHSQIIMGIIIIG